MQPNRSGFALPMAILLIGFMTAGIVAAFTRIEAEGHTIEDQSAEIEAFAIAVAGLDSALSRNDTTVGTRTFTIPGGTATVQRIMLRNRNFHTDTAVWIIRSTGRTTKRGARAAAERIVAQIAFRTGGTMQVLSSWTSLSGLDKAGAAGDISGQDECGQKGTLAGVAVPTGEFTGHDEAVEGDPPIQEMGTEEEMAAAIKIDWLNISNALDPAISPNYILCKSGTYGYDGNWTPCSNWPGSSWFSANPNSWPVIVINGSSALPSDGRGTLIVTGDLTFGGGDKWDGIILVGGKITDNGSGNISGAVVSGLNVLKGDVVGESSKANGTKDYSFNSCEVEKAANAFARIIPMKNAWMDNWPGWS